MGRPVAYYFLSWQQPQAPWSIVSRWPEDKAGYPSLLPTFSYQSARFAHIFGTTWHVVCNTNTRGKNGFAKFVSGSVKNIPWIPRKIQFPNTSTTRKFAKLCNWSHSRGLTWQDLQKMLATRLREHPAATRKARHSSLPLSQSVGIKHNPLLISWKSDFKTTTQTSSVSQATFDSPFTLVLGDRV